MNNFPKVTFGMIVLNGEPLIRYNLHALYPFAHEIIVVEGAAPAAATIATPDGHSMDGTIQALLDFKAHEDPANKLIIVTAEDEGHPNGFWPGEKDEQSQAYAKRATGSWLWQVDVDEFYQPQDMHWIISELLARSDAHAVSFKQIQFWGGLNYYVDGWYLRHYGGEVFHRLFRWGPGYTYATHRPPRVANQDGIDLRKLGWIKPSYLTNRRIYLYHYSFIFPHQVAAKSAYYAHVQWGEFGRMQEWAAESFERLQNPYRVHNIYKYPSWLERFDGKHPPQITAMWNDLVNQRYHGRVQLRRTDDIDSLLRSRRYWLSKVFLKIAGPVMFVSTRSLLFVSSLLPYQIEGWVRRVLRRRSV